MLAFDGDDSKVMAGGWMNMGNNGLLVTSFQIQQRTDCWQGSRCGAQASQSCWSCNIMNA